LQELPDRPSWLIKQAVRSFYKELYRRASWLCWMELLRNPDDYFALCWYANSLYFLGRHNNRKAASLYERAIEINSAHPLAHAGLGRIHYSNALRIHREYSIFPGGSWMMFADEKSPEDSENKNKISILGYADSEVGNRKIAIKELEMAADLSSNNQDKVGLLYMAAVIYCIIDNKQAIKVYNKILYLDPQHILTHYDLAGCYASVGDSKHALQEYKYLKEHAPEEASNLESVLADFDINIDT
jgi:tetratricopeptide (TPR) repeat protein